jgi:hypothetical protein
MVGWTEQKEIRTLCVSFLFIYLFIFNFFVVCQIWLTEHNFCVMQKLGIVCYVNRF